MLAYALAFIALVAAIVAVVYFASGRKPSPDRTRWGRNPEGRDPEGPLQEQAVTAEEETSQKRSDDVR